MSDYGADLQDYTQRFSNYEDIQSDLKAAARRPQRGGSGGGESGSQVPGRSPHGPTEQGSGDEAPTAEVGDQEQQDQAQTTDSEDQSSTEPVEDLVRDSATAGDRAARLATVSQVIHLDPSLSSDRPRVPSEISAAVLEITQQLGSELDPPVPAGQISSTVAITALLVGLTGMQVRGLPPTTERLAAAFAGSNPALSTLVSLSSRLLEELSTATDELGRMQREVTSQARAVRTTELMTSYLVAESTGEVSTRYVTPQTVEIDQQLSLATLERSRRASDALYLSDRERKVRDARRSRPS